MIQKLRLTSLNQKGLVLKCHSRQQNKFNCVFIEGICDIVRCNLQHTNANWKKLLAAAKFSTSVTNLPQAGNSSIIYVFIKLLVYYWFFRGA